MRLHFDRNRGVGNCHPATISHTYFLSESNPGAARAEFLSPFINSVSLTAGAEINYPPTTGTSEELALEWLVEDDAYLTAFENEHKIVQRFAIADLYFRNGGPWDLEAMRREFENIGGNGHNCADQESTMPQNEDVLVTTLVARKTEWLGDNDECQWQGVSCLNHILIQVVLYSAGVRGELTPNIGLLFSLKILWIGNGAGLTGTVPSTLFRLTNLEMLSLENNGLHGTILEGVSAFSNLVSLNLSRNNFIEAFLPHPLLTLTALQSLSL